MARPEGSADEVTGVAFPLVDGARRTTATGRGVFADAVRAMDPASAAAIEAESDWRRRYVRHLRRLVEVEITGHDPDTVARAGLDAAYARFEFVRDGATVGIGRASAQGPQGVFGTIEVEGKGPRDSLAVPYRGQVLEGDALHRQLDAWVAAGTVERSFATAIRRVMANPDWLELSGHIVAILGAGAEMGPLGALSRWGVTVAVVDVPHPRVWQRVLELVRRGAGRALVPLREPVSAGADDTQIAAAAGADVSVDLPEVAAWLEGLDGPLVVGNYVYAVGADNARVAMAADAVTAHLLARRDDVTIAGLLTPTDVYAVPEDVVAEAQSRFERAGRGWGLLRGITAGRAFTPNYTATLAAPSGDRFGLADCLIAQQGPNYALAKRLQRWRLRVAREAGVRVSANIAPATNTRSVTRNRLLAAAYAGAPRFDVEVFEPTTSNTLMAALLVHDLHDPNTVADPAVPLAHPCELFTQAAAHGGLWRQPFAPRSVLPAAALLGFPKGR